MIYLDVKETLLQRSQALEEAQTAAKTTINKRRQIERLKASSNIRAEKVDEALEELEEVSPLCLYLKHVSVSYSFYVGSANREHLGAPSKWHFSKSPPCYHDSLKARS